MKTLPLLAFAALLIPPLIAQAPSVKPKFEVASIKPNKSGSLTTSNGFQACRYVANNATLKMMVAFAYRLPNGQNLPFERVIGGPSWIETDHFDVEAKRGDGADSIAMNQFILMIQSLLEERFQLRTHFTKQDFPAYDLVVAKEGLKLPKSANQQQPTPAPNPVLRCVGTPSGPPTLPLPSNGSRGGSPPRPQITYGPSGVSIDMTHMSLASLSNILRGYTDRPIVNKTGITGLYDVKLHFSPERGPTPGSAQPPAAGQAAPVAADPSGISGPSIFTAIQELGLKLESSKASLDVLVIDSVQKPSEN
jgi:uncharacterized protein (TIGR03435 family)